MFTKFYTDNFITNQHQNPDAGVLYNLIDQFPKCMWSMLITAFLTGMIKFFKFPKDVYEEELSKELKTLDLDRIKRA